MFFKDSEGAKAQVTTGRALIHLVVFQIKLAADALRDFLFSPISILVFIIDAIRKPALEDSLYLRMMMWGRRSDRMINLFDEHKNKGEYTVDAAIDHFARAVAEASAEIHEGRKAKE